MFRNVCTVKPVRTCEKYWETQANGAKVWVDNPAKCEYLIQSVCEDVPYDDCQEVHKLVPYQVIKYKPTSNVPCYSRMGVDKYGIPDVEIAFPDGSTDRLNIGRFKNQEGRYIGKIIMCKMLMLQFLIPVTQFWGCSFQFWKWSG